MVIFREGRKEFNVGFEKMIMFYFLTRWWMVIVLLFFKLKRAGFESVFDLRIAEKGPG